MRRTIWLVIILPISLSGNWESIGPYGGILRGIAVSYSNDNLIYAVSDADRPVVAKSTNGGVSWRIISTIPQRVRCLKISPTDDNLLYAGGDRVVFRSTDGGVNWVQTTITTADIYDIAAHPTQSTIIFGAGQYQGGNYPPVFVRSTDGGVNWTVIPIGTVQNYGHCIAVDRMNPNIIYVGAGVSSGPAKVFKSTDQGSTWTDITGSIPSSAYIVYSIAVHPMNSNIVYVGTQARGIYRSTDGGVSWAQVSTTYYNYRLATSLSSPDVAYCGCETEIYKTTNAGVSWVSVSNGLKGYKFYGLAVSNQNVNLVYAGNDRGAFKTTNGGSNWIPINENFAMGWITAFTNAPSIPWVVYASLGTGYSGYPYVFRTTNSGMNWSELSSPIDCGVICEFAVGYDNSNLVYALEGSG